MIYVITYLAIGIIAAFLRLKSLNAYTAFPMTALFWLPVGIVLTIAYILFLLSDE
jgi:hypothetical protein